MEQELEKEESFSGTQIILSILVFKYFYLYLQQKSIIYQSISYLLFIIHDPEGWLLSSFSLFEFKSLSSSYKTNTAKELTAIVNKNLKISAII